MQYELWKESDYYSLLSSVLAFSCLWFSSSPYKSFISHSSLPLSISPALSPPHPPPPPRLNSNRLPSPRRNLDLLQSWSDEKVWQLVALGRTEKFSHGQLVTKDFVESSFVTFICKVRVWAGSKAGKNRCDLKSSLSRQTWFEPVLQSFSGLLA